VDKDVIKKYKEVFDYWIEVGDIWVKYETYGGRTSWVLENYKNSIEIHWDKAWYSGKLEVSYVQADQYADLRRAQADGKTIQYRSSLSGNKWVTLASLDYLNPNFEHRIKPDEPAFKVGDWVRYIRTDGCGAMQPFGTVTAVIEETIECIQTTNVPYSYPITNYQLWKPQPGEWCWFWTKEYTPILGRYDGTNHKQRHTRIGHIGCAYDHCEPFIGTLPTTLKG